MDTDDLLEQRLVAPRLGPLDVVSDLDHFALVTYAVDPARLIPHIPQDRFALHTVEIDGERRALLSVVPFLDVDFHFARLPFARFRFGQTNHRVYVTDGRTGEPAVWFFGTTLGSRTVHLARTAWRIPWHHARYTVDCAYDAQAGRYERFAYDIASDWCSGRVRLTDTGTPAGLLPGFSSMREQQLVLTHPLTGLFRRLDGRLGTYSVWHELMELTVAEPVDLHFSLYERLGILSADEMQRPHSVLVTPRIRFQVHLPPRRLRDR